MKVSDTLNKAADVLQEHGWRQGGQGWRGVGGYCLEGCIFATTGHRWDSNDWDYEEFVHSQVFTSVESYLGDTGEALYEWNDAPGRTAEEVIEALRAAAVIEAAKESADERESVSSCS